jgi:hypothetical protein
VLSNPELRAKYDKHGAAGLDVQFVDPSMIFGERLWTPVLRDADSELAWCQHTS